MVLYLIREAMGAFVLGALLAFLIAPSVDRLARLGIPRALGILIIFLGLAVVVGGLVGIVIPILLHEVANLRSQAPILAGLAQQQLSSMQGRPIEILGLQVDITSITNAVSTHGNEYLLGQFGNALGFTIAALSTVLQLMLILIVAFLVAHDHTAIRGVFRSLVPSDYRGDFDQIYGKVKAMLYSYMRGQLLIAGMIGVLSGIAVAVLGLPYAIALGLVAAVTALVPYLGPFIGAVPAILIGLSVSPGKALEVTVVYFVISFVILNFVYPKIMGDAVKLPPILVIVAFIAGFSAAGILGMFVAIPIAATIRILFDYVYPRMYGQAA
jgi:predicted PurR-regulated permease PerM